MDEFSLGLVLFDVDQEWAEGRFDLADLEDTEASQYVGITLSVAGDLDDPEQAEIAAMAQDTPLMVAGLIDGGKAWAIVGPLGHAATVAVPDLERRHPDQALKRWIEAFTPMGAALFTAAIAGAMRFGAPFDGVEFSVSLSMAGLTIPGGKSVAAAEKWAEQVEENLGEAASEAGIEASGVFSIEGKGANRTLVGRIVTDEEEALRAERAITAALHVALADAGPMRTIIDHLIVELEDSDDDFDFDDFDFDFDFEDFDPDDGPDDNAPGNLRLL
ncbi:MAG: hypothetical protein FWD59_09935 [Micrococcales bacterium]|nr:hypothetical protein [Micrococcales bacterium]